ncbi:MAG TPA: ribonuclease Z [Acetobacteraceae bacterium]|jgi:ribonuclease BN (tRNA processing enzyme)|nr:ribonuclease Z [Acetobacteraceae bacterium]
MRITLLGVGEAFDPAEPNSSALVEEDGFSLMIDCGHSVVAPFWRARPDPDAIDAIYFTHHHMDHILGLPPLIDRWAFEGRRKELLIVSSECGVDQLRRLLDLLGAKPKFPIAYAVSADTRSIGPFATRFAPTGHPMPNHAILLACGGHSFAYSGDGQPTPESLALYRDADLLMHECFDPEPADNPFHTDLPTVRVIAGPARIGLYHVHAGSRPALRHAIAGDPRLFVPDPGQVLEP